MLQLWKGGQAGLHQEENSLPLLRLKNPLQAQSSEYESKSRLNQK